jgi:hypothetical protein
MNCCFDCMRFLNRKGYQKINSKTNNYSSYNKLKEIVVIKNDDTKEVYNFNNLNNLNNLNNKENIKKDITKLSLDELKSIVSDEDDIVFDLNYINNQNDKNNQNNKNNKNNQNIQNNSKNIELPIKSQGIVNNSKNENLLKKKYNKLKPKNKLQKKLNIRKKLNLKKTELKNSIENDNIKIDNSEILNKSFSRDIKDKLSDNNNLRNRNEGLSDLEWDIIGDEVF